MNIVKFKDIVMTPEVLSELGYIEEPGYLIIGQNLEHFDENPLPEQRATICLDYELPGMVGTWNKNTDENPFENKPLGRNVGYGLVVSGLPDVFEHDEIHFGQGVHKRTYTVAIQVNENYIENTKVFINSREYILSEIMDGPNTQGNSNWVKALYISFPNDRNENNIIRLCYSDHIEETFEVACIIGADDFSINELGGTNVKYLDPLTYEWKETTPESFKKYTVDGFCDFFNTVFRNKYVYAIHWAYILPMISDVDGKSIPVGNPFEPGDELNYVNAELENIEISGLFKFNELIQWMDEPDTINILQKGKIKYDYLNEFTPDDDITIDELKHFRQWLASILLANVPMIEKWNSSNMLVTMLTYYKQNLNDTTTGILADFTRYMENNVLVSGTNIKNMPVNLASLGLSSGCGCNGGVSGVGNITATSVCDPLQIYRNAIYNFMVETFSNIDYWMEQVEICVEMKKYLEGILKVGLPLGSKIIDPYADCGCNTLDSDSQVRYRKMIEALIQSLTYIIEGNVSGNRNYVATSFANWATYLYEYMYWA